MTTDNKIYGCGANTDDDLGLENKTEPENFDTQSHLKNQHQPVLISSLQNVIEIRPSTYWSLALCSSDNTKLTTIINHWSDKHIIKITAGYGHSLFLGSDGIV